MPKNRKDLPKKVCYNYHLFVWNSFVDECLFKNCFIRYMSTLWLIPAESQALKIKKCKKS